MSQQCARSSHRGPACWGLAAASPCFRREPRLIAHADQAPSVAVPSAVAPQRIRRPQCPRTWPPGSFPRRSDRRYPGSFTSEVARWLSRLLSPLCETNGDGPTLTGFFFFFAAAAAAEDLFPARGAAAAHPPFSWSKPDLHGCTMATFVCRVQFLDDTDPFNSTNFPEPTRPPLYTFREDIPLINQIAGVHRLLKSPHRVCSTVYYALCLRFCVSSCELM